MTNSTCCYGLPPASLHLLLPAGSHPESDAGVHRVQDPVADLKAVAGRRGSRPGGGGGGHGWVWVSMGGHLGSMMMTRCEKKALPYCWAAVLQIATGNTHKSRWNNARNNSVISAGGHSPQVLTMRACCSGPPTHTHTHARLKNTVNPP